MPHAFDAHFQWRGHCAWIGAKEVASKCGSFEILDQFKVLSTAHARLRPETASLDSRDVKWQPGYTAAQSRLL